MAKKSKIIEIDDKVITVVNIKDEDYISLTDMLKAKDGDFYITDWLRNKNTLEFLSVWERLNNPDFDQNSFIDISQNSGLNSFKISVKEFVKHTNAIGIYAKAGRNGGTYAHKDIAFEFGSWISPTFKLYLITEYQRLKEVESNQYNLEWNVRRILSKTNYELHTDAIKEHIIPKSTKTEKYKHLEYAEEADLLNLALFGCTAKQWREANPQKALNGENIRDMASINELAVLSNIESFNAEMIKVGMTKKQRFDSLKKIAESQLKSLDKKDILKSIKKLNESTFIDEQKKLKD